VSRADCLLVYFVPLIITHRYPFAIDYRGQIVESHILSVRLLLGDCQIEVRDPSSIIEHKVDLLISIFIMMYTDE